MRKYRKNGRVSFLFVFVLICFQFHCLLNPIVREILDLDPTKKNDKLKQLGLLLGLYGSPTAAITPSLGNVILANSKIQIVFNRTMNPNSLTATLGVNLTPVWSDTYVANDTVVLSGSIPVGTHSFILDVTDSLGIHLSPVSGNYTVLAANTNLYYVSPSGNDGNLGTTPGNAKLTIISAISAATPPAAVFVSEGNYLVNSGLGTQVNLVNNVSLYGGFSSGFLNRNSSVYVVRITDTATANADTIAVNAGATITTSTVVDGFTIRGASNPNAPTASIAFNCLLGSPSITNNRLEGGVVSNAMSAVIFLSTSSAFISNNTIQGGNSSLSNTFGVVVQDSSSPTVVYNIIYGGVANGSSHGIYNSPHANTPTIVNNTVDGGTGNISYAFNTSHPSNSAVTNNFLNGGSGNTSYAIYHGAGAGDVGNYQFNTLFTSGGSIQYCLYEDGGSSPISFNGNRLFGCQTALYYDQGFNPINSITTINGGTTGGPTYSGNY
ncbi:hypothetical protein EHQ23_05630 [Leptospira bourretii]|uniref:DUF1565 domain-containing protein n=1 Tax=Leptospira bourretii TaxID=2484962 RepID=A0A4R9IJW4_9LEPT|nr:hypothetical protein EHQ23_05630 [Leptospira bourretii]TGK88965.1 hypothetical protein EHQ26_18155 [Leptospira bourretii]TGL37904.1 hypothetical protein EHQ45_06470 [Leptospira bourretii]